MIIFLIIIGALCLYKLKLPIAKSIRSGYENGIFGDYMSIEKTASIKGVFILIVFLSHAAGYLTLGNSLPDRTFSRIVGDLIGQSMVAVFMLYSGYGVMLSIEKKGRDYVKSIPAKRFFRVLLHFDIAVLIYYAISIAMHKEYGFTQFLISLTGWSAVGNSNWYIFDILVLYLITYVSFIAARNNKRLGIILNLILCAVFVGLLKYTKGDFWWYDTVLCYPAGMLFYYAKPKFELLLQRSKWIYWAVLIALLGAFAVSFKFSEYDIFLFARHILFAILVVMVTIKFSINNRILNFFGTHLFSIYILQRIPMNILSYYGCDNKYLFVFISFVLTIPICLGFDWAIAKLDSVIFKNRSLAKK